ncbi:AraC family transcriptional regulator [Cryptosporangium aurantiacum]|uniref:Transcriptional regulator, AraC family n=1 Tax=Cryptosporangium aurantiacum TaxID=134849 RepID=A0A1M7RJJ2_9ACTN|nr:AraC family transcriptional regulator [Cryptosporangium aurantiacum]SHN46515.1 transcriptional regulator, AraC family [Cryptosporangium aurantiacum]
MDTLAGLLDGPRARGAFLLRSLLTPPWSLRIEDESPLALCALVQGSACILPASGGLIRVEAGDVMIFRGPDHYTVSDHPDTVPQVHILPGQECRTPDGMPVGQLTDLISPPGAFGVRTWGNDATGGTEMVTGAYQVHSEVSSRLLATLPPVLVIRHDSWDNPLVGFLADEIVKDAPGQAAVLDRLLDLLLIGALRTWFARQDSAAPGWYRAHSDPVVGPAVRMLQSEPARPWTVALLARETGVSRAALARRFTELVGEPPMAFLTGWRLALAADLLREPDATLAAVARKVGYGSPFALSSAFKRFHGVSPQEFRSAG